MSRERTSSPDNLAAKLRAALTDEQIQTLLHVAAETGQLHAMGDRLREADPNLADTVRRILDAPDPQPMPTPSSQKTIQIWSGLWEFWESWSWRPKPNRSAAWYADLIGPTRKAMHQLVQGPLRGYMPYSYFNESRVHQSLGGETPAEKAGGSAPVLVKLADYRWQSHCQALAQLPIAA